MLTSYVSQSDYKMLIFKFHTIMVRLNDVKNLTRDYFQADMCIIFLPRKYDVISQLRHNYATDPFCMTRLK